MGTTNGLTKRLDALEQSAARQEPLFLGADRLDDMAQAYAEMGLSPDEIIEQAEAVALRIIDGHWAGKTRAEMIASEQVTTAGGPAFEVVRDYVLAALGRPS